MYESGQGQPTATITEAVSWLTGGDELDLDPIADSIDVDALEALFREREMGSDFYRSSSESPDPGVKIAFEYEACAITVESGQVTVERL